MYFPSIWPSTTSFEQSSEFQAKYFFIWNPHSGVMAHSYEQRIWKKAIWLFANSRNFKRLQENVWRLWFYCFSNEFVCTHANGTCLRKCKVILIRNPHLQLWSYADLIFVERHLPRHSNSQMTFHNISNIIYTEIAMQTHHTHLILISYVCACVCVLVMSLNNVDNFYFFLFILMHQFFCRRTSIHLPE